MKKTLATLGVLGFLSASVLGQTIAQWTFETSVPASTPGAGNWFTNISAEVGTGTASGRHAGAATYNNPAGNGSLESFQANTWAVGDFFQFAVSTVGYSGIGIFFYQTSSTTGPEDFALHYSADGVTFTPFGSYTVLQNAASPGTWNSSTTIVDYGRYLDLSSISAIDNQSTVYFRLVNTTTDSTSGGTVTTAGTSKVDDVRIGIAGTVPEPSSSALAILGLLGLFTMRRNRR